MIKLVENLKERIQANRLEKFNSREREAKGWYASMLGTCMRKQYLKRANVKPTNPPTAEAMGKMRVGLMQEENFIKELKEAGFKVQDLGDDGEQIKVSLGDVSGRIDALVDGYPLEIKSQQSRSFWYKVKKGEGPARSHRFQLGFYLLAGEYPRGTLVYISKDDGTILEYDVTLDDGMRAEINKRIADLDETWKQKKVPVGKPDEPWECSNKWCNYYSLCQKMGYGSRAHKDIDKYLEQLTKIKEDK